MGRKRRISRPAPRLERLESRTLLHGDVMGMWPLANPTPENSILVRFQENSRDQAVQGVVAEFRGYLARSFPGGASHLVLGRGVEPDAALARLRQNPAVLYAEPDALVELDEMTPNDPRFGNLWGFHQNNNVDIDAPQAWDITTGSTTTIVAVTDTGIDYTHPDLYRNVALSQGEIPTVIRGSLVDTNGDGQIDFHDLNEPANALYVSDRNGNRYIDGGDLLSDPLWSDGLDTDGNGRIDDLIGWNYASNTKNPMDGHSHGTHVSGTIAATANNAIGVAGVNWNARILPLKFMSDSGSGSISAAASAIYDAVAAGARVINASWGGASSAIRDAIAYAAARGVVFVASAGNDAADTDVSPHYPSGYPLANILSVAALTSSGALASFSNHGATTVDLGAPGSSILSTMPGGGYGTKSGTSMAAPHVTGVVSLLVGLHPEYSAEQLVERVLTTTKPLASLAGKTVTGGMASAFQMLSSETPPPPPPVTRPAPTGLTANAISSSEIQLGWTGTAEATGYLIEHAPSGSTNWVQVGSTSALVTSFLDAGLNSGTTYLYRVRATYSSGNSDPSETATATTLLAAPEAPTNLTATSVNKNRIRLNWVPPAQATTQTVFRSLNGLSWTAVVTLNGTANSYQDNGLTPNTTYFYRIIASNAAGDSPPSAVVSATTKK